MRILPRCRCDRRFFREANSSPHSITRALWPANNCYPCLPASCIGFITLNGTMKPKVLPILLILLSAVWCLGRTGSDDDTAHAIKGALRRQESMA